MPRLGRINPYLFIAVPLAVLFVFTLLPTVAGLGLSLFTWDGAGRPVFVGLENFRALGRDPRFGPALVNTLIFVLLTVPASTLLGFLLAVAVHARWFVGKAAVRTMLFLPTIVAIIAIGFVWRWLLDDRGGLLPAVLRDAGVSRPPDFLQGGAVFAFGAGDGAFVLFPQLTWPLLSIVAVQVWRTVGFCMVLYLASLTAISESLYEAAEVDGASRGAQLRHITWPQVAPMTAFLLVIGVIGALQVFDIVWAMTAGAETDSTRVLNLAIYREFQQSRFGYASAIGVVIFGLTALATVGYLWLVRREGGR